MSLNVVITIFLTQIVLIFSQDPLQSGGNSIGTGKIGESCERDYQCINRAFCRVQQTCLCEPFYAPGPDMGTCHATSGTACQVQDDCSTMSNSECIQGVCTCKDNFILDIKNSSNCIMRPSREGDRCQRSDECIDALDRSHCINEKCKCFGDYKFINETGKCMEVRGIYQPCKHDFECYDKYSPDGLICKDNKECAYKNSSTEGFDFVFTKKLIVIQLLLVIFVSLKNFQLERLH